jgi:hypothetical protein
MPCPSCQAENDDSADRCARCGAALPVTPTEIVVTVDLKPGAVFHSRYEILAPLGRGGMGVVYKARDRSLDEVVAIKILRPDFAHDPRMAERFKSEIRLARKVRHRNVCAIHDFGEERGLLYISMELVGGTDLKRVVRERGPLPADEGYELAIQVAEGLQAVHDAGIIHRDLKTPNIMRDAEGMARLMDFGIAKRAGAEGTMTGTGNVVGTPEYMSPEQGQGQKLDFRSDVYALGVVIYEMFTASLPFKGETPISTILKHMSEPPPLDTPAAAGLPESLKPVLRRAMAKDREARYASARDLAEALRRARSPSRRQQPVPTIALEAPTLPRRRLVAPARGPGPRRWMIALPVLAAAGGALWMWPREPAPASEPAASLAAAPSAPATALATSSSVAAFPSASPSAAPAAAPLGVVTMPTASARPAPPASARPAAVSAPRPSLLPSRPATSSPPPRAALASSPLPSTSPTAAPEVRSSPAPAPAVDGVGWLQVVVRPWGEVSVDGKVIGSTPLDRFSLKAGTHQISVRHPAYERVDLERLVRADQTERVVVDFAKDGVRKP